MVFYRILDGMLQLLSGKRLEGVITWTSWGWGRRLGWEVGDDLEEDGSEGEEGGWRCGRGIGKNSSAISMRGPSNLNVDGIFNSLMGCDAWSHE